MQSPSNSSVMDGSPLLQRSDSTLSFAGEPEAGNKTEHRKGTVSLSLVVQGFLILSLVLVVLSISLLFRFLSVVAVDRVGGMYFDAAAAGVKTQLIDFTTTTETGASFLVDVMQYRHLTEEEEEGGLTYQPSRDGEGYPFANGNQVCEQLSSSWSMTVRMQDTTTMTEAPTFAWGVNCSCLAYLPSFAELYNDTQSNTTKTRVIVNQWWVSYCDKALLQLATAWPRDSTATTSGSGSDSNTTAAPPTPVPTPAPITLDTASMYSDALSYTTLVARNGSLVELVARRYFQVSVRSSRRDQDGQEILINQSAIVTAAWTILPVTFRTILDAVHFSQGTEGITTYFELDAASRARRSSGEAPLVESYLRPKAEEGVLSTETVTRFAVGVKGLDWVVAVEAGQSIVTDLQRGTYVVVVIALAITLAVAMAAVLALRVVLTPLGKLRTDMMHASQLKFDGLVVRTSFLREINEMNSSFGLMVTRLRSYKPMLLELMETRSRGKSKISRRSSHAPSDAGDFDDPDAPPLSDEEEDWENRGKHHLKVTCRFLSRGREIEKQRVSFEFPYADGDKDLFRKFSEDCLTNLDQSKFEIVSIYSDPQADSPRSTSSGGSKASTHLHVKNTRQLEQLITHSPGEIHVALKRSGVRTLLSPFCLGIDLVNFSLNLAIIFGTFFVVDNSTRSQRLSVYTFTGLYGFAFAVNVAIALLCLKKGQQDPRFAEWLIAAGLEVSILLLCCSLNTQHVHFLWSQWSLFGALRFNAPRPIELWKACVKWSLFGFFFSDLMQLFYKVFRLWNDEPLTILTGIALATSVLSIGLNLPKKVTFFAMARRSGDAEEEESEFVGRSRSGGHGALYTQEVTVMLFRLPNTDRKSTQRLGVECSAFYTTVLSTVKRCDGTVVHCHGPDIVALFNSPKAVDNHWSRGLSCALSAVDALKQFRVRPVVAVTTDILPVGTLGSQSRKSFQCCGGVVEHLNRHCNIASTVKGCSVVATKKTLCRIDGLLPTPTSGPAVAGGGQSRAQQPVNNSPFKVRAIPTLVDEILFEVKARDGMLGSGGPGNGPLLGTGALANMRGAFATVADPLGSGPHQLSAQAKLLPLFGVRPPSSGKPGAVSTLPELEEDTKLMHFLGKRLVKWLAADDKAQGFNHVGDEEDMLPVLFPRGREDGDELRALPDADEGAASDGSEDSTEILLELAGKKKKKLKATPSLDAIEEATPPTQQQAAVKKLRTVGFILGHVLRKSAIPKEPLRPEDVDL